MLTFRILSALVGIPVTISAIWYGGFYLLLAVTLLALIGYKEFGNITSAIDIPASPYGYIGTLFLLFTAYYKSENLTFVIAFILLTLLATTVLQFPYFDIKKLFATLLGILYVGLLFGFLLQLRNLPQGNYLLIFLFVLNWLSDTFAYFVGKASGKTKLAPKVSPNKTVEGSLGGIFGAVIGSLLLGSYILDLTIFQLIVIGGTVSIFGQLGDLAESALKRMADIKDSGNLIPGHGGVLDRFDSVLFTAPLLYMYIVFLT